MRKLTNAELERIGPEELRNLPRSPIVLILDNVRSLNNIGSIFRSADAFRIEAIHLCGITAQPPHREIQKTALGATESVPWKYFEQTKNSISELKQNGFLIYAVEQVDESISLEKFAPIKDKKYAFIFGHEVHGVDENLLSELDGCIEIPQFGSKHSLNISVSAGIVVWEIFQKINSVSMKR